MHDHTLNQTIENKGHSSEELIHRLTDRLLKIKAYKDKEAIGDPIDVRRLFNNAQYRRHFLREVYMESDEHKLQLLAKEALVIDMEIQRASAEKEAYKEEVVVDEPAGTALSARRVPEVIFAKHEDNEFEDEPKNHNNDKMIAKHEHPKITADMKESNSDEDPEEEDFDREGAKAASDKVLKQPIVIYGIIAALALLIVLAITGTDEEGGEEELVENVTKEAELQDQLPPLLPKSALDPLAKEVLRIHGSYAVELELMPMLVINYLVSKGASDIKLVGINPHDKIVQAKLPDRNVPVTIEIESHESSTAFEDLDEFKASIGIASRPISEPEIAKLLGHYGNLNTPAGEHVFGMDGLAIIVNRSNPVSTLTMEQIGGLFSGGISDWSQVGGRPGPVNLHVREERAGTWDTFKYLVLDRHNQRLATTHQRFESEAQLSDSVASDAGGIGFVRFPYVRDAKAVPISDTSSTVPFLPTQFRAETEEYPLSRRLYMYTSPREQQKLIDEFVFFVTSPKGQAIIQKMDFIPLKVYKVKPLPPKYTTRAYQLMTKNAERLSLNFHFKPHHIDLDTKGIHDVARVAKYIAANPVKDVLLLGFTDSQGGKERNRALSAKRAEYVAHRLREYGIVSTTIRGLGESMPVANNDSEFGRNRNRRVEVWVK